MKQKKTLLSRKRHCANSQAARFRNIKKKKSKVNVALYSASSRTRLYCDTASRTSALISVKLVLSQTPAVSARARIRASVSRDVPVYSSSLRWVLIRPTHGGMAQAE